MIDVNDLMIDNIVLDNFGYILRITDIRKDYVECVDLSGIWNKAEYSDVHGYPLTIDLLKQIGLDLSISYGEYVCDIGDFRLYATSYMDAIRLHNGILKMEVCYLHELQNLCYVLKKVKLKYEKNNKK